jgi:hypothetical protein
VTRHRRDAEHDFRCRGAEVRDVLRYVRRAGSADVLREPPDRIAGLTPDVPQTDSTELIRDDRLR